jgi:class 3 adenylate cyclase
MPSERIQRRIDRLLDEAEAAADQDDWHEVRRLSDQVLRLDHENEDARTFLEAADHDSGALSPTAAARSISPTTPPPAPTAPPHPERFAGDRYEVRRHLGDGATKRVFLVRDTRLDREVALALVRTEGLDSTGRERVAREAQSMGRLGAHANLVTVHDVGEESGQPYIVEEYMAGGSVADVMGAEDDGATLPLGRSLAIAQDVCAALEFIHGGSLVHRDLKPSNVFLAEDGTAKLGDFGLAVALDRTRLTQDGSMVGTASYMPPEQALGGAITAQSDLYALGAMLYELVTGRPPFVGDDPTSVISQHINTPPVAPSWHTEHCPPDLEELIVRLLQKAPQDRPESATEVREALGRVDPEARSASHSGSGANPLDRLARGVFVGREAELDRLRSAFDGAFAGRGSMVMLVGEPGIGKTRTVQELETYAEMRGASVLWGRNDEASGAPAYWPWINIGNANARTMPPQELAGDIDAIQASELTRIFPALLQLPNVTAPEQSTDNEAAQFRLFDAYAAFMRVAAERTPLVLVLDDLHWADKPSLLLLQHLARSLSSQRMLVIGTYRDTDLVRTHPLSEVLAELTRDPGFERIVLRGLSDADVGGYIRQTAHVEAEPSLVRRIHDETEGNAFFMAEVVNLMAQEGTLSADSLSDIAIPDGVRQALGRRLNLLSEEANELLTTAAVVGREFPYETLALLREEDRAGLVELIDEALDARVIEELDQPGRYRFSHAQMQETLLGELSTTRRVLLHGQIAEALERRYGDRAEERAARLARHFFESSTLTTEHAQRSLRYGRLAAEQAKAQAGWAEAARHYEDCLAVIEAAGDELGEDRAALLLALGRCHTFNVNYRDAFRSLMQSVDLYRGRGDWSGVADATVAATRFPIAAERAESLLTAALDLPGQRDPHQEAQLLITRAIRRVGIREDASTDADAAQGLAEKHRFEDIAADLIHYRAATLGFEGRFEESAASYREAFERRRSAGDYRGASVASLNGTSAALTAGILDLSENLCEEGLAFQRDEAHDVLVEESLQLYLGELAILRGDTGRARALADGISGRTYVRNRLLTELAEVEGQLGEVNEFLPAPALAGTVPGWQVDVHGTRARALFHAGDLVRAGEEFSAWSEIAARLPQHGGGVTSRARLGPALAALGSDELVRSTYEVLTRYPAVRQWGTQSFDDTRGQLALRLGLVEEARQHYRTGLGWAEREGAPVIAGQSHQGLAEVAIRRGETAEAMHHLDQAADLFQQHGAKLYLDQVIAKKLELQGGAGSSDSRATIDVLTESIGAERPDLASRVAPDGTVTILFSDIEGSTALNVELGDDRWMELLGEHNRLVRSAITEHRGYEVKTEGDAFMVAFQSARDALRCAIDVQRAFESRNDDVERPVRVRIGLHTGEPVREGSDDTADFYGTHVVMASRIASQASGGEVLVSALLRELVASSGEFTLDARPPAALKGLDGEHVTYAVEWA